MQQAHTCTHTYTCSVNTEELECAPVLWQRKFGRGGRKRVSSGQVHSAVSLQQGEVFRVLIFLKGQQPVKQTSTYGENFSMFYHFCFFRKKKKIHFYINSLVLYRYVSNNCFCKLRYNNSVISCYIKYTMGF